MKRRFCFAIILVIVSMSLISAEERAFDVVFDTRTFNPFYVEFGFRISENQDVSDGSVAFSSMKLEDAAASSQLQLQAYWSITSAEGFDLSLEMDGPLVNEGVDSTRTLDWKLEWKGDGNEPKVLDSTTRNLSEVLHTHVGREYVNDSGVADLRGEVRIPYSSKEFKDMALDEYRGTLTLKVTSIGE